MAAGQGRRPPWGQRELSRGQQFRHMRAELLLYFKTSPAELLLYFKTTPAKLLLCFKTTPAELLLYFKTAPALPPLYLLSVGGGQPTVWRHPLWRHVGALCRGWDQRVGPGKAEGEGASEHCEGEGDDRRLKSRCR